MLLRLSLKDLETWPIILKPLIEFLKIICGVSLRKKSTKKGFGPDFLQWVRVLMSNTKSCVNYCGWLSSSDLFILFFLSVDFGIRQGCQL